MTMKMISSTSTTSTRGVTFICGVTEPFAWPTVIATVQPSAPWSGGACGVAPLVRCRSPPIRATPRKPTRCDRAKISRTSPYGSFALADNQKLFFRSLIDRNTFDDTLGTSGVNNQNQPEQNSILRYTEEELDFGQLGGDQHWSHA